MRVSRTTLMHMSTLVAARLLVTFMVRGLGFEALSDDDFARVTIAQAFAFSPTLDPSGTSWLPFPFWLTGAIMMVFGRSLAVAEVAAVCVACASELLVYASARAARLSPTAAWLGVLLWTFVPVGIYAGTATVPELPTAALCASALLLLRSSKARQRMLAGVMMILATWSRYEAWPIAVVVAGSMAFPLRLDATRRWADLVSRIVASILALVGPAAWMIHNHWAHGDALHFHARVSAYWFAMGASDGSLRDALMSYPKSVIVDAPVLAASFIGAVYWAVGRNTIRTWAKPILGCFAMVSALTCAQLTGGAPTHHPERTLLAVWAVGWIVTADLLYGIGQQPGAGWDRWRRLWLAAVVAFQVVRTASVSSWYGIRRDDELAVGAFLEAHEGHVLLSPTDYGYFAIQAASGAPERFEVVGSVDPRKEHTASPFDDSGSLPSFVSERATAWVVARGKHALAAEQVGTLAFESGEWRVIRCGRAANEAPEPSGHDAGR